MHNEMTMNYLMGDGREFRVEKGTASVDLGFEDHGMFGLRFHYQWGLTTTRFIGLDTIEDFDIPLEDRVKVPMEYMYPMITSVLKVFNADYLSSIQKKQAFFLFSPSHVAHEGPLGIVNLNDYQNVLIFEDVLAPYKN